MRGRGPARTETGPEIAARLARTRRFFQSGDVPDATAADGTPRCRWCLGPVTGRRTAWCSESCVSAYWIRASGSAATAAVRRRDKGICAACGLDCVRLERVISRLHHRRNWRLQTQRVSVCLWYSKREPCGCFICRLVAALQDRGFDIDRYHPDARRLWEADHILSVADGGGCCGIENYRTLCQPCHKARTKDWHGARADRRRGQTRLFAATLATLATLGSGCEIQGRSCIDRWTPRHYLDMAVHGEIRCTGSCCAGGGLTCLCGRMCQCWERPDHVAPWETDRRAPVASPPTHAPEAPPTPQRPRPSEPSGTGGA